MTKSLEAVLRKQSFEAAVAYSRSSDLLLHYGKKLAINAGIKQGDKVLDMGCGTGELTSFLGKVVGIKGQVVGVDPRHDKNSIRFTKQFRCKRVI